MSDVLIARNLYLCIVFIKVTISEVTFIMGTISKPRHSSNNYHPDTNLSD